jgi:FADH2 O2-dependent halogenase
MDFDIAVVGAGFAGSLTALLLRRLGKTVLLIDRGSHPRFAIGESSTPSSNLLLRALGLRYDLPELVALSRYGSWKQTFPDLPVGLKRGFSYFAHTAGADFSTSTDHDHELLVAASSCDELSDTNWLRADFDHWLVRRAISEGVEYLPETSVRGVDRTDLWRLELQTGCEKIRGIGFQPVISSPETPDARQAGSLSHKNSPPRVGFVIEAGGLDFARHLGVTTTDSGFLTNSRSVFAHWADLPRWDGLLPALGIPQSDYPFPADDGALHHLFDAGWMWQLRFDHGVTSSGFVVNQHVAPPPGPTPQTEWTHWLKRLPSVAAQFSAARVVAPESGLVSTQRLQRRASRLAGDGWVALPNAAGFVDPLFSPGNAHVLAGIERVVRAFEQSTGEPDPNLLADHVRHTQAELAWIDELIAGCYQVLPNLDAFAAMSAHYFAAAVAYERHRQSLGADDVPRPFLLADELSLREAARSARDQARTHLPHQPAAFVDSVRQRLAPWNPIGLLDPSTSAPTRRNMLHRTALE